MTATPRRPASGSRRRRVLLGLEFLTGAAAVAGGVLLAARPDGSLLQADPAALAGSPFRDWRLPGVLLASLVGGGYLTAGGWQWREGPHAHELSLLAGVGLIGFELVEPGGSGSSRWKPYSPPSAWQSSA
jgi:hypothetical protein